MFILYQLLTELKNAFACSRKGKERRIWFVYTFHTPWQGINNYYE